MPFSFIIFIYCFIVKPFETVIVIRGCNKLDLLGAAVGEGKEKEREVLASSSKEHVS